MNEESRLDCGMLLCVCTVRHPTVHVKATSPCSTNVYRICSKAVRVKAITHIFNARTSRLHCSKMCKGKRSFFVVAIIDRVSCARLSHQRRGPGNSVGSPLLLCVNPVMFASHAPSLVV